MASLQVDKTQMLIHLEHLHAENSPSIDIVNKVYIIDHFASRPDVPPYQF